MKKIILIAAICNNFMAYSDWDNNRNNNHVEFSISWQGANYGKSYFNVQGVTNIFTQQNLLINKSIPSFVVVSNNQPAPQKAGVHQKPKKNQFEYYLVKVDGQKEIVSKEKFNKELDQVTDAYVQSAQIYFGADMSELAPMIRQAILQGTINVPEMHDQLIHQAIIHAVTTGQTELGIVHTFSNHPWIINKDLSHASLDDQIMINYVISRLAYCNNNTIVELAQGCLRSFDDAQQAENENEEIACKEVCRSCYSTLLMNANITPKINEPNANNIHEDLVDLYYSSGESIDLIDAQINSDADVESTKRYKKYRDKLIEREAVVLKTLQNDNQFIELTDVHFTLSTNACGYLMANNINYALFDNQKCIYLQHLLTNQIVDLLEKNVKMSSQNLHNYMLADFIKHTCNLAVAAQQLNQEYQIKQAVTLADISEFFTVIGDAVLDCLRDTSVGVGLGVGRSLQSWVGLGNNLCTAPITTVGQGIKVLADTAIVCGHLVSVIAHHVPRMPAYNLATMQYDTTDFYQLLESPHVLEDIAQKYQSAKTSLSQAVEYSIPVVELILQRPAQENIADVTQCIVDGLLVHGIGKALSYGAQFAKVYLAGAAETIVETIAPHLMHEPFHFVATSAGDIVACIDRTGEIISDVAQVAAAGMIDGTLLSAKYIAQGKVLSDKVQQLTNADKPKIEAFQKELEPFLRCDKIINIERLKSIEGIEQIDNFKRYTNNFTNLEKLTSEEILYLNLCDWLEPQATKINARLKDIGGLKFIDPASKMELVIEKYDLFHSLLGEMTPGNLKNCIGGGHLPLLELRTATLEIGEINQFGKGFFDMKIKVKSNRKMNSYFPLGTSVDQAVGMIEVALANTDKIKNVTPSGKIDNH